MTKSLGRDERGSPFSLSAPQGPSGSKRQGHLGKRKLAFWGSPLTNTFAIGQRRVSLPPESRVEGKKPISDFDIPKTVKIMTPEIPQLTGLRAKVT